MLIRFYCEIGHFRTQNKPRKIATEAPLDANGGTFGLQNLSRCNAKRPKTHSKSATFRVHFRPLWSATEAPLMPKSGSVGV